MDCVDIYLKVKNLPENEQQAAIVDLSAGNENTINEVNAFIEANQPKIAEQISPTIPGVTGDNFDEFDVFERVEHLTGSELENAVFEACGGVQDYINEVNSLLNGNKLQQQGFDVAKIIESSLSAIQEGTFDPASLIGAIADNYHIIKHIKTGGNSFIYLAERLDEMHHQVVVKVIKPHLHNLYDYDVLSREANILFKLNHKYIVPLNGAGILEHNGIKLPFYRMPFISDDTIVSYAKRMGSSLEQRIKNIIKVCDAVDEAHNLDTAVIHSDIKPPNVLMDSKGEPKLIDFGIAQHAYEYSANDLEMAKAYAEKYSDAYSCPELLTGKQLSVQADVYSITVMLYELITELAPERKNEKGNYKFNIEKKLPSKHIVKSFIHKNRYKLCLSELDSIVIKGAQKDIKLRYSTVRELRDELQRFLDFKEVQAAKKNYFYTLGKMLLSTPKFASFAVASLLTVVISTSMTASVLFERNEIEANYQVYSEINDGFYKLNNDPDYYIYDLLTDGKQTLKNAENASNLVKYKSSLRLAKMADMKMQWPFSEWYYSTAIMQVDNDIELLPKLAKALYKQSKLADAEFLINRIYDSIKRDGISTNSSVIAYLDLLDFDTKYISSSLDDKRQDLDILEEINNQKAINLPGYYHSKLNYLLANEYYYYYFGDAINPTAGTSEQEYNSVVEPVLKKGLSTIKHAINLDVSNERKAENYALMARIEHELKNYKVAEDLAEQSYFHAKEKYGQYHEITDKALVAKYSVNRFNDLEKTIVSANKLVTSIEQQEGLNDDWFYSAYLLSTAYLYAGDFSASQQILSDIVHYYDKKNDSLVFKGLDGITVAIINHLEFTHFDFSNSFYKKIIPTLFSVFDQTRLDYPDYVSTYESSLMALIDAGLNNQENNAYRIVDDLLNARAAGQQQAADDLGQLALNAAGIMFSFGNDEMSYLLAQVAEDNMLSDIYLASKDFDKYDNAIAEANVVFNNHYRVLKDTSYAQAFKNIVITKN